jgi:hypothetical protein
MKSEADLQSFHRHQGALFQLTFIRTRESVTSAFADLSLFGRGRSRRRLCLHLSKICSRVIGVRASGNTARYKERSRRISVQHRSDRLLLVSECRLFRSVRTLPPLLRKRKRCSYGSWTRRMRCVSKRRNRSAAKISLLLHRLRPTRILHVSLSIRLSS